METKKKKLSKKAVIIGSVVLAVVLVVGGVFIYKYTAREKLYTFDEITQGLSEQVSYVVDADGELTQEEIDEVYERYKRVDYSEQKETEIKIIKGDNPLRSHLKFYNDDDEFLFEVFENMYSCKIYFENSQVDYEIVRR